MPEAIGTEVFLMPAAGPAEKSGSFTNTQRLLQWHNKAVDPPGDARSESWFVYHLGRMLKERAARERTSKNAALNALTWELPVGGAIAEPDTQTILAEINGRRISDNTLLSTFEDLKRDGSTMSGCWIYTGVMPEEGNNRANTREPKDLLGHDWGFAWPKDTRVLYNRASAKPDGTPWSEEKKFVWWDSEKREWTGKDITDFKKDMPPDHKPDLSKGGMEAIGGDKPFGMHPDGRGWLYVSSGLKDGPLPTHFEPLESPLRNPMYPEHQTNPPASKKERPDNPFAEPVEDPRFPFVLTTYRLTEHHTAGGMSRVLSHLSELQPELFAEISPELAELRSVSPDDWITIVTPRGIVSARALITARMPALEIDGRTLHQVGLPYHWGWKGLVVGDVANDLLAISQEPNVRIMETKGLVCNLVRGRHASGPAAIAEAKQLVKERP